MKIPSKGNVSDIMAMGANTAEQAKDTMMPDFKSYMQQSASKSSNAQAAPSGQKVQMENAKGADKDSPKDEAKVSGETKDYTARSDKSDDQKVTDTKDTDRDLTSDKASADDEVADADGDMSEDSLPQATLVSVLPFVQYVELISSIQERVQELLGISTEEFDRLLGGLDISLPDLLLNGEVQKQFFLATEGAQPLDLLTDEQLADMLSQMRTLIDEAVAASDMDAATLKLAALQLPEAEDADTKEDVPVRDARSAEANVQTGETMETPDGSHVQFSVETDRQQDRGSQMFRDKQTELSAVKEHVLGQLNQAMGQLSEIAEANETVTPAEIVRQVVEEIKLVARQDTTSMELQLYPEHLGKVAIQVSSRNGAVTAQITAENEMARAALESSIQTLKETFQNQGLKVEAVEVMVATSGFSQEQFMNQQTKEETTQSGKGGRRLNLEELDELAEDDLLTEDEQLNVEMMRREGRNVDYTA